MILSCTEGALVVAVELLGTKILSPVLGSTVYVWAVMLSVTLFALGAGYFIGGWLSRNTSLLFTSAMLVTAAAFYALAMPMIGDRVFYFLGDLTFFPLLLIESTAILVFPLLCLGAVSPLIIQLIHLEGNPLPASRVFFISTIGGVISGFIISFLLIGRIGALNTLFLFSLIAFLVALPGIWRSAKVIAVFYGIMFFILFRGDSHHHAGSGDLLYHQNGVLGDITVVRFSPYDSAMSKTSSTWLFVNSISQTMYDPGAKEKYFTYAHMIRNWLDTLPAGSDVLLCGMGGGSIVSILQEKKFSIDVCELDARMPVLARKYFGLRDDSLNITIDDARHFIKASTKKYDAVILDIFRGEETPNHVLSIEGLADLKRILSPKSVLIINSHGYLEGSRGDGNRVIHKTLSAAGFLISATFTAEKEELSNILFVCSESNKLSLKNEISPERFRTNEEILTDWKPRLEKLNRQAALAWRIDTKRQLYFGIRNNQ